MNREDYIDDKNVCVRGFINFLVKDIKGEGQDLEHQLKIRDKNIPKNYNKKQKIACLKDAYKSYFWDSKVFDETSRLLAPLRLSLCEAYYSGNKQRLVDAAKEVFDWGLMPKAAVHNENWAKNHINFVSSIKIALRELSSDKPDIKFFDDKTCRMNSGFTKVYALLHPGSIIYDGRVGAALGFLVSKFLINKGESVLPPELAFPWGSGPGDANRNPSTEELKFPKINSKNGNHAKWNIRANWIIQEVVKKCVKSNVAPWLTGEPVRQLEAALFMIGYEVGGSAPATGSGAGNSKALKHAKQDKPRAPNSRDESKKAMAKRIYSANSGLRRKEIIEKFIDECGLTKNGASTYYSSIKKELG